MLCAARELYNYRMSFGSEWLVLCPSHAMCFKSAWICWNILLSIRQTGYRPKGSPALFRFSLFSLLCAHRVSSHLREQVHNSITLSRIKHQNWEHTRRILFPIHLERIRTSRSGRKSYYSSDQTQLKEAYLWSKVSFESLKLPFIMFIKPKEEQKFMLSTIWIIDNRGSCRR